MLTRGRVGALAVISAARPVLAAPAGQAARVAYPARAAEALAISGVTVGKVLTGANLQRESESQRGGVSIILPWHTRARGCRRGRAGDSEPPSSPAYRDTGQSRGDTWPDERLEHNLD